jgi:hypothetical protein
LGKLHQLQAAVPNQLSIDLASAFVSFVEANYGHAGNNKHDKLRVIDSLRHKIVASSRCSDNSNKKIFIEEMNKLITNLLSNEDSHAS